MSRVLFFHLKFQLFVERGAFSTRVASIFQLHLNRKAAGSSVIIEFPMPLQCTFSVVLGQRNAEDGDCLNASLAVPCAAKPKGLVAATVLTGQHPEPRTYAFDLRLPAVSAVAAL